MIFILYIDNKVFLLVFKLCYKSKTTRQDCHKDRRQILFWHNDTKKNNKEMYFLVQITLLHNVDKLFPYSEKHAEYKLKIDLKKT